MRARVMRAHVRARSTTGRHPTSPATATPLNPPPPPQGKSPHRARRGNGPSRTPGHGPGPGAWTAGLPRVPGAQPGPIRPGPAKPGPASRGFSPPPLSPRVAGGAPLGQPARVRIRALRSGGRAREAQAGRFRGQGGVGPGGDPLPRPLLRPLLARPCAPRGGSSA